MPPSTPLTPRHFWAIGSSTTAVCLLLMLLHQSDSGTFFGRYSATYMLQLGGMVLFLFISLGMWVGAVRRQLPELRADVPQPYFLWALLIAAIIGLALLWLFLPGGRGQPAVALFSVYVLLVGSGCVVWVARQSPLLLPARSDIFFGVLALSVTLLLSLRFVGHLPASLLYDEPWVTNWGVALWQTGTPQVPMYPLLSPARALMGSTWFVPLGAWLDISGVSLVNARWFWWLLGMMSVPFLAATAGRVYGRAGAVVALTLALGLFLPHNYGRWDVGVLLALSIALYTLVRGWQTGRWQWYAVSGMAVALTLEGHFLSLRWIIAFGGLLLAQYWQAFRQGQRGYASFWAFLSGGILGCGLFLVLHTLAWGISPLAWWAELTQAYSAEAGLATTYGTGIERIGNLAQAWLIQTLVDYPLETGTLIIGLVAWAIWGDRTERRWLLLMLLGTLSLFFLQPKVSPFYAVHHLPFTILAATSLLIKISTIAHQQRTIAWGSSLILVLSLSTAHIFWLDRNNTQNADQTIALGYILETTLPPEIQRIAARQPYYYGLAQRDFVNIEVFHRVAWQEWEREIGLLPHAIIITRGWDDAYPAVWDYITAAQMVKIACYPLDIYGGAADVYALPQATPAAAVGC